MSSTSPSKVRSGPGSPGSPGGSATGIWIAVGAVVVLAGIAAVVFARGSKEDLPPIEEVTAPVSLVEPATLADGAGTPLVAGGLPAPSDDGTDSAIGSVIPTVKGTGLDGKPLTIGPDGTPKVVVFMAHWCPHCQAEIPRLVDHFESGGLPEDVDVVGVSTAVDRDREKYPPTNWLDREDWTQPTLLDSPASDAYAAFGVGGFPFFMAVDADGTVVARTSGEISTETFDALVEAARSGSQPR